MNTSWWRQLSDMDEDQQRFILLPESGKYLLVGPAGSGKTNLLLLRAKYLARIGFGDIVVLAYTNSLVDFIKSGIKNTDGIQTSQIKTYHSWMLSLINEYLPRENRIHFDTFNEATREAILSQFKEVVNYLPPAGLYDAIFIDEVQDLSVDEVKVLLSLTERLCICGDVKQSIYMYADSSLLSTEISSLEKHELKKHYRIGHEIARVADKLHRDSSCNSLEATSNYNASIQGTSSVSMTECDSRDQQFDLMLQEIRVQLDAFHDENIGVLCGKKDTIRELNERFKRTDLADIVSVYNDASEDEMFQKGKRIYLLTMHSSKGTEFKSVHLFGLEELPRSPLQRTNLIYTAVTRAKTSLRAYRTGHTTPELENAFAQSQLVNLPVDLNKLF